MTEMDYLLGVSDATRQGALRLRLPGEPEFLAPGVDVPPLIDLPRLLGAADAVGRSRGDDWAAVKMLLDAGTASLGGARPKATVMKAGRLMIAKFPHAHDEWDVMAWEAVALDLAESCGIEVPAHELVDVGGRNVLVVERFDRRDDVRIPYISAMSLTGSSDGQNSDYTQIAEALAECGARVRHDLEQLWRRMAFSVVVNNVDDHLRNHGMLWQGTGWVLSPAFDINPDPRPEAERVTSIGWSTAPQDAGGALLGVGEHCGLDQERAAAIWDEVAGAVRPWRDIAGKRGITSAERDRFAPVLDRYCAAPLR